MSSFHGNFFLRSTDLISLPCVNPDSCVAIEMSIVETLKSDTVVFQTALLHTSSSGDRRIRVITLSLPVTNDMSQIYLNADQFAIAALLTKKAVDRVFSSKLEDAREALAYKLAEILAVYKHTFNLNTHTAQLLISENLKLLPIMVLGMIKNVFIF